MKTARRLALVVFALTFLTTGMLAQDATGNIVGNVTDVSGGAIVNAKVMVTSQATQAKKAATTDGKGYYQVRQLPVGMYKITAEATGFSKTESQTQNPLDINQTLRVDLRLDVGNVTDTVTLPRKERA